MELSKKGRNFLQGRHGEKLVTTETPGKMLARVMPELLGMSDRIAVMCEGHLSGILDGKDATDEKVMYLASTYQKSGVTTDAN